MTAYTIKLADMPDEVEFSDDWLDEIIRYSVGRIEYEKDDLRLLRRIEELIAENKLLREALKPFADEGKRIHDKRLPLGPDTDSWPVGSPYLTLGDLRRATVRTQEPKP